MKKQSDTGKSKVTSVFCPNYIMSLPGINEYISSKNTDDTFLNKYNGPIWMDFSPGSYIGKDGNPVYTQSHKCEYVDKELIKIIIQKMKESEDKETFDKYQTALEYFINN